MNLKIRAVSMAAVFFTGSLLIAQKKDSLTTTKIDEVVVVAFGKQKKEAITGSVTTVDEKVIANQQAPSVTSALQGTAVGVNVITSGGQPGNNPAIYIRGIGSINSSTQPLIVLDGSPYNGNINNIPQDQVESITVLKDASSTALYGSRASNGVVIITTKKGRANSAPRVTVTSLIGVSDPAVKLHETLNAADYMKYDWQALRNSNIAAGSSTPGADASGQLITSLGYNPYDVATPIDANGNLAPGAKLLWDTDWEKALINKAAFKQEHRFNVSGGDSKTTYFLGAEYLNVDGTVKTSNFERTGVRLNVESKVKDYLKVGMNSAFTASSSNLPIQSGNTYGSSIQWIYSLPSIYPIYRRDANGALILDGNGKTIYDYGVQAGGPLNSQRPVFQNENAVGALYNNSDVAKRNSFVVNAFAEATITKGLSLRSQLSYEQYTYDEKSFDAIDVGAASSVGGRVSQERDITKTINFTNSLNYDKKFGDHSLGLQGIFEVYQTSFDYLLAQGTGFIQGTNVLNTSTTPEAVGGYYTAERLVRYLGRATYNYKNKYFVEGSYSRDGSTRFSPDTRFGNFYGLGASWILTNENFLQDSNTFSLLKLRGSYGELGNNNTSNPFAYQTLFQAGYNQLGQAGVVLGDPANYNLTWESTITSTIGLDFGLFQNRINGSVDYFTKQSKKLIYNLPTPASVGNSSILTNVGAIENRGWEGNLNTVNFKNKNFTWTTNFNISTFKNKVTELGVDSFLNGTKRFIVGRSIFDFFLPEWAGVDSATGMGTWFINDVDANGNVIGRKTTTDYNLANNNDNKIYAGSSIPDFYGGLTNYFKVGPVDLNILFNYSFGSYVLDGTYQGLMSGFSAPGRQQSVDVMNAWQNPGDVTDVPINIQTQNNNNATSTRFLFKNDYVRLKSLTLGYNINKDMLSQFGVNSFRIFVQGDNVWTWQSHKGIDPEQGISGTTDSRSYQSRTLSLGVTVGF
ncbi:TonB-linked outer membrane protein, SusC/RagA family [Halpernia humi]|uniref:TonB-linked outer membrane protein, SusC/RagA family n=1 Tax=Halpernia humi TaxID=493375 RepID=A0A1H5XSN6_9FLAO|nr:SusC/RagA family TonB-linked outer membrane protein [Halpernia humi]SEG14672.1 TonB-linked outer membrane protein, SusC/RagA family [Halpernia humi]